MTIRKHLEMMENLENGTETFNESYNKGDDVKVKDDVKNPQIKKFAGKTAKVTNVEDEGKTIHAKVKGARHSSMEFKSSELEPLNEDVSNRQQKRKEKNDSIISREEDKTIVAPLSNDALKHYARGTKFSGSNFDTYFHEYNIVLFFVLMKNGDKFIVPFSSDKDKVVGFYDEADTRISEQDFSSATGIKNIEQKLSSMHNKNGDAIEQKRHGVAESNLNEDVDVDQLSGVFKALNSSDVQIDYRKGQSQDLQDQPVISVYSEKTNPNMVFEIGSKGVSGIYMSD